MRIKCNTKEKILKLNSKLTSFISHLTNVKKLFAYDLILYVKIIKSTRNQSYNHNLCTYRSMYIRLLIE